MRWLTIFINVVHLGCWPICPRLGECRGPESIGSQGRATMAKLNRANTCPKKKQSRRAIGRRMVQENDFHGTQPQTDSAPQRPHDPVRVRRRRPCGDYIRRPIHTKKLKVAGQATVSVGAKVEAVHEAGETPPSRSRRGPRRTGPACRSGFVGDVAQQKREVQYLG